MLYNIHFEDAAIAYLIVLNIYIRLQFTDSSPSNKYFRRLAAIMLLAVILDVLTAVTISYHQYVPIWVNIALNTLYFATDIVMEYIFVMYCACATFGTKDKWHIPQIAGTLALLCAVVLVANVFTGIVFSFNEDGYQHGPIYMIVHIMPIIEESVTAGMMLLNFKKFTKKQRISIILYILVLASGPVVQILHPNVLFILFTVSIGLMLLMFAMETPDYQALTKTMDELRKTRDEAEEAMAAAQTASQAKTDFLSNISHEIRTPINAILGYNDMVLRDTEKDDIAQYCTNIQSAGKTLLSMINDMMDYTQMESGNINLEEANYSTASMISDIMTCGKYFSNKKDIEMQVSIDSSIPKTLHGDSARITRVFSNLLSNSVKYTDFGHIGIVIKWEPKTEFSGWINAEVTDTGIGLHNEDIERITSAFHRANKKRTQHIQGLGLGLTIVTKLLAMMGSTLSIESEYGKGTSIKFRLLQGVVDPAPMGEIEAFCAIPEKDTLRAGFTAPSARLLAVDDNIMNLELYRGSLKDTKIQIDTAANGIEALELISRYKYDLIILDHMMPLMDGMETLKTIKKQNLCQGVPILVITANAVPGEKSIYLNAGFDDYLSKPVSSRQLLEAVKKYLPQNLIKPETIDLSPDNEPSFFENGAVERLSEFLDIKSAMAFCLNSEELYLNIVNTYYSENRLEDIRNYYKEKDFENYRIQVHALKSGSRTIGAGELSDHALALEMAARNNETDFIIENTEALLKEYSELLDRIGAALKPPEEKTECCGLNVLYVDDDLMYRSLVKRMLRDGFGNITVKQSAEEALEMLDSLTSAAQENNSAPDLPHVILLDLNLSGSDGISLLKKLRSNALYSHIPVVIYSSDDNKETQLRCLRAGASDFIAKPADWEILTERLKRLAVACEKAKCSCE